MHSYIPPHHFAEVRILVMLSFSKKLYLGFSFVLILLASVSITSYVALTSASSGFGDYRSLARAANAVGRVQANMLMVRMSMKDFIASSDEKDKQSFDSYFSKTEQFITEATTLIKNPEQSKKIKQVDVLLNQYNLAFEKVVTLKKERNKLVNDVLNVKGALIEENLTKMLISAKNDGDISAAYNASLATRNLLLARVYALKFLASNMQSDAERVVKEFTDMKATLSILNSELKNPERRAQLEKTIENSTVYQQAFDDVVNEIYNRNNIINQTLNRIGPIIAKMTEELKLSIKEAQDTLGPKLQQSNATAVILVEVIAVIAILFGIFIAVFITRSTLASLGGDPAVVTNIVRRVSKGDLATDLPNNNELDTSLYAAVREMVKSLQSKAGLARKIADGDLSAKVTLASDKDILGQALQDMVKNLNSILANIQSAGDQIAAGSSQVSNFSHALADGANQQKDNLQTIAAALEQLSVQTSENALSAKEASQYANSAQKAVVEGQQHMQEMVVAMNEIKEAGENIEALLQTIDEIAKQTNLLALNAAIEAARAGEQGRGFAVVADEVRGLAFRSTNAAAETAKLIQLSSSKTDSGTVIAKNTYEALQEIFKSINDTTESVSRIALASNEQSYAVDEVSRSIVSVGDVVEQNAAGSLQGAAAAEELSNEAATMKETLKYFTLDNR